MSSSKTSLGVGSRDTGGSAGEELPAGLLGAWASESRRSTKAGRYPAVASPSPGEEKVEEGRRRKGMRPGHG